MSKDNLKKFYIQFYKTGQIRSVKAKDKTEAYHLAEEQFGEASGNWMMGYIPKVGQTTIAPTRSLLSEREHEKYSKVEFEPQIIERPEFEMRYDPDAKRYFKWVLNKETGYYTKVN